MKKFLALILSLAMVFALVACGDEKTDDSQFPRTPSTNLHPPGRA